MGHFRGDRLTCDCPSCDNVFEAPDPNPRSTRHYDDEPGWINALKATAGSTWLVLFESQLNEVGVLPEPPMMFCSRACLGEWLTPPLPYLADPEPWREGLTLRRSDVNRYVGLPSDE